MGISQPSALGVGVSIGGSKEVVGPEVTVSLSGDDGWDFSMTLGRNLMSSQDPGMPGVPEMSFLAEALKSCTCARTRSILTIHDA